MKRTTLVGILASITTVVAVGAIHDKPHKPTEQEIVEKLPPKVRALLAGGLCDNIHGAFVSEVRDFPGRPYDQRPDALERIEYYREWLRRAGCG